ncbi:MAG: SEC-C metal-binding domain-containing protein [Neisseria sp.]|nr:SEC-C metal-binding domain-containing protein [Neisseria sp.]
MELNPVEHIDFIRELYAQKAVEVGMYGDIEDVEIRLGLREQRSGKRPHYYAMDAWAEGHISAAATGGIKIGRNDPCPCGSGKKYKKCCML